MEVLGLKVHPSTWWKLTMEHTNRKLMKLGSKNLCIEHRKKEKIKMPQLCFNDFMIMRRWVSVLR